MLPKVRERKSTLVGVTKTCPCELVSLRDGAGVLRYVIDRSCDIAGFTLSPGDETLAVSWEGRPYTLYRWLQKQQGDRAYYLNIADSIRLRVDLPGDSRGAVRVPDEHEMPGHTDGDLPVRAPHYDRLRTGPRSVPGHGVRSAPLSPLPLPPFLPFRKPLSSATMTLWLSGWPGGTG